MGMQLAEAGVVEADYDQIVNDAMNRYLLKNNPIPSTPEGCRAVLEVSL